MELFNQRRFPSYSQPVSGFQQISLSHSRRGALRGIHCSAYSKLFTVINGAVYDVIVDLRVESPTFRRWCAVILSHENRRQVHIPAGCGHAFLCLEDADVLYLQGGCFDQGELSVSPFDSLLDVYWPTLDNIPQYVLSEKDKCAPAIHQHKVFKNLTINPIKRVLIIGASGQVGGALIEAFGPENVIGTFSENPCEGMVHFNLESAANDPAVARDLMILCRPQIVCICAGRTWVDGCEVEGHLPMTVNCEGPRVLVRAAKACGARSVYFSTDYVFKGDTAGKLYLEDDPVGPVNAYGSSKLAGEVAVMEEDEHALVLRTTGVFGPEKLGKNFVYQLLNSVAEKREMLCAVNSFGTPTYNRDLARMTIGLLDANAVGIYHCVGNEALDRYTFATIITETFSLDQSSLKQVNSEDLYQNTIERFGFAAFRGNHLGMLNSKVKALLPSEYHPRSVIDALLHWKSNERGAECKFISEACM